MYGKATETAFAALSRLAEVYDGGATRLSAKQIAESRGLQHPFVSKILSTLSQAGIIEGARGPGGGFSFVRNPKEVALYDVFRLFERENESKVCPFGGGICGSGDKCPLHDKLIDVQKATDAMLRKTSFDVFRLAYQKGAREKSAWRRAAKNKTRKTYRAIR